MRLSESLPQHLLPIRGYVFQALQDYTDDEIRAAVRQRVEQVDALLEQVEAMENCLIDRGVRQRGQGRMV